MSESGDDKLSKMNCISWKTRIKHRSANRPAKPADTGHCVTVGTRSKPTWTLTEPRQRLANSAHGPSTCSASMQNYGNGALIVAPSHPHPLSSLGRLPLPPRAKRKISRLVTRASGPQTCCAAHQDHRCRTELLRCTMTRLTEDRWTAKPSLNSPATLISTRSKPTWTLPEPRQRLANSAHGPSTCSASMQNYGAATHLHRIAEELW
jgi:hypothetical protein